MRKDNNRAVRNVMLNTLRIAALVICFVMVFGFALTTDIFDFGSSGMNTYDNIAEAAGYRESLDKDGAQVIGTASPITGDNGALTATHFGFQSTATDRNTTSWTFTETFDNFEASLGNHQAYKNNGNTTLYTDLYSPSATTSPSGTPTKNHLNFGVADGALGYNILAVINYNTSGLLQSLLNHPGFKVTVQFSAKLNGGNVNTPCVWAMTSKSGLAATDVGLPNGSYGNSASNGNRATYSAIELTAAEPYLTMCMGASWGYSSSRNRWVIAEGFQLKFTITTNSGWTDSGSNSGMIDYAAPALASTVESANTNTYYPFRDTTEQLSGENAWIVWNSSLSSALNSATDSTSRLRSYTNISKTLSTASSLTGNGKYYKSSSLTYVDMYDYNNGRQLPDNTYSKPVVGDSVNANFASGLKTVQVGNATDGGSESGAIFNIYDIANGGTFAPKLVYVDGEAVGYATVTKINRTRVTVNTYMFGNARVVTTVTDFGAMSLNSTLDYSGIDSGAPTVTAGLRDDISAINISQDNLTQWWRLNSYIAEGSGDPIETDIAPLVFYYAVQKSDTLTGLADFPIYGSIKALIDSGIISSINDLTPIAVGSFSTFEYSFTSGTARGINSQSPRVGNAGTLAECTGAGYYRFSFYTADLAGNLGKASIYYVKVDSDQNVYDLTYKYTDAQNNVKQILPADNGSWATGATTLKFTLERYSLSGNSLLLINSEDTVLMNLFFHKAEGSEDKITFKINGIDVTLEADRLGVFNIPGVGNVNIKYSLAGGKPVFELSLGNDFVSGSDTEYVTIDTVIKALLYTGEYDDTAEQSVSYTQGSWSGNGRFDGVALRVDRNAPVKPEMRADEDMPAGSLSEVTDELELPQAGNRIWFTNSNYVYNSVIEFFDDMAEEYDVVVYFGIKNVTLASGFAALNAFASNYKTASSEHVFDISGSLKSFGEEGGGESLQLTLRQDLGAGMRVIFMWAVDQAGNYSELNRYYILADGTNYTVNSALSQFSTGRFGVNAASVTVTNEQGQTTSTFKRGEKVVFGFHPNDDFVPYTFVKLAGTDNEVNLLKNDTATSTWEIDNIAYQPFISLNSTEATITVDDLDNFGALYSNSAGSSVITYTFAYREVVTYELANNTVSYTGAPTIVPIGNFSDPDVLSNMFEFKFTQKSGEEYVDFAGIPSAVGDYKVTISINSTYIIYYAVEPREFDFTIIAGVASVEAVATSSTYGTEPKLEYRVIGMSEDDAERISGSLKLNTTHTDLSTLPVGQYQIESDETFEMENYTISFSGAYHTVLPKSVTVTMSGASKSYGDAEPDYFFTLNKTELVGADNLFYNLDPSSEDTNIATFNVTGLVTREAGENVDNYSFSKSVANFNINPNYNVEINTDNFFSISRKEIMLGTDGQSAVAQNGFDPAEDYKKYSPQYTIPSVQNAMSAEIRDVAKVKFSGVYEVGSSDNFGNTYNYTIVFDETSKGSISNDGKTLTTDNFILLLTNDTYVINVADAETIVISAKNTIVIPLTTPENLVFVGGSTVPFSYADGTAFATNFNISGADATFNAQTGKITINGTDYRVEWTLATSANSLAAGDYTLYAISIRLVGEGENGEVDYGGSVLLDTFTLTVTPLTVYVRPVFDGEYNYSRIYGSTDFTIGFEAYYKDAGDTEITISGINGRFVRALYSDKNELIALGTIYDDVNSTLKKDYYYGVAVGTNFTSVNRNITLEVPITSTSNNEARFTITPKSIVLNESYFNGVSKPVDGNTNVPYNDSVKAIDLFANGLIFSGDDVDLSFVAAYDSHSEGRRTITFSKLGLEGADASNYYLAAYENGEAILEGHSYTIDKLTATGDEDIIIYKADIVVRHEDFTFTKQYDGTTKINKDNLTIFTTDGTRALTNVKPENVFIYGNYPSENVSDTMIGSSISVFFGLSENAADIEGIRVAAATSNISIITRNLNNMHGVYVTITNASMSITKRVINADSFADIQAVNRDYDASTDVAINYIFAADALAKQGQFAHMNAVDLKLFATADSKDAGDHKITFSSYSLNESAKAFYDVDLLSINNKFSNNNQLEVVISRAKLYPNISIAAATYSASSVISDISNVNGTLTTLNYADKLATELAAFSFKYQSVSFAYSINGAANGAVAFDIDGNVIRHNVLVTGLVITENGDNSYLNNYKLYGMRYVNGEYYAINQLKSGQPIDAYELLEFAQLDRKEITIVSNSIYIEDKIYDGNADAYATAARDILDTLVFEADRDAVSLDIAAKFASVNVGNNIPVTVTRLELVDNVKTDNTNTKTDTENKGDKDNTPQPVARNYVIKSELSTLNIRKNIKGAPITFTAELQSKTYNKTNIAQMTTNGYTLEGFVAGDTQARTYGITTEGAYFDDENVRRDAEGTVISKKGTVYGLTLRTTGSGTNNYVLAYSSKTELLGKTVYHKVGEGENTIYYYLLDTKEINGAIYNYYDGWYESEEKPSDKPTDDTSTEDKPTEDTPAVTAALELGEARGVYGIINPKSITLSVEKLKEDNFVKQYDGTTKFFGKYGQDFAVAGINGIIAGDDAGIDGDSIIAEYLSSAVSANAYVLISNVTLIGADAGNYTYRSVSRQLPARIVARDITAILADGEVEYGTINPDYSQFLSYQMSGKGIIINSGAMYMNFREFIECVGLINGVETDQLEDFVANDRYIAQLESRRYRLDGDVYVQAKDGEFIRLVESFNNPRIVTVVDNYSDVGEYNYSSTSIAAGNYNITAAASAKLNVIPATIYVHASVATYGMLYGQAIPTIAFRYLDANGNSGFRGRDREADVFTTRPTANFVLYNTLSGKGANVTSLSKISSDLNGNECYIVFINIPSNGINANYNVVAAYNYEPLGNSESIEERNFAVLTISLPTTIAGLSAANASVEFNNADQGRSIISGLLPDDRVSYFINGTQLNAAINKGVYTLRVKVERPIVAADGDNNNYYATWEGEATLTINAVSPSLSAPNVRVVYNGNLRTFDRSSISAMVEGFDINNVSLTYQKRLANGQYDNVQASDLINAGTYRVVLAYTSTGDNDNYLSNTYNVSFVISKITVNVTLTSDTNQLFDAEAGNTITYTLALASGMPTLAIPQTNVSFSNGEVGRLTKAGRYTFTINAIDAIDASNFEFAGGSGVINVGVKSIDSVDVDNNVNATINTNNDSTLVVEQFNVKYVYSGATTNTNDDDMYWGSVNKYMPDISRQTNNVPTSLQAIVRMSLTYNTATVGLSESVNISVRLPENVAKDMDSVVVYTVNKEGKLVKLSNYTLSNGNISYETDYLSSLVFVKLGEEMPTWQLAIIIVVSVVAAGILIGVIVGVVVKKKRNKKAA